MNIIKYEYHIFSLVFDKCNVLTLLYFARCSKKYYNYIEDYLNINKKRFNIPKNIGHYNNNIHYLCEEYITTKCFECGNPICFYYYKNWNTKICGDCLPLKLNYKFYRYFQQPEIMEYNIKGFTKRELRNNLSFKFVEDERRRHIQIRCYHKSDIIQITKNRYGFNSYKEYTYFIHKRFDKINNQIIKSNLNKINIKHKLSYYFDFKKSKSGFIFHILNKEVDFYKNKINTAIIRYNLCKDNLKQNELIYNQIKSRIGKHNDKLIKLDVILRLNYKLILLFDMEKRLENECLDYHIFYSDNCFKYFYKPNINIDKVINKILY